MHVHGNTIVIDACSLYVLVVIKLLDGQPEQGIGQFPPASVGVAVEDRPSKHSCMHVHVGMYISHVYVR